MKKIILKIEEELGRKLKSGQKLEIYNLLKCSAYTGFEVSLIDLIDECFRVVNYHIRYGISEAVNSGDFKTLKSYSLIDYLEAGYGFFLSIEYVDNHRYSNDNMLFVIKYEGFSIENYFDEVFESDNDFEIEVKYKPKMP